MIFLSCLFPPIIALLLCLSGPVYASASLVFPFSFPYSFLPELLAWVGVFLGFPPFLLTLLAEPFSLLHSSVSSSMARTKMTANPPPPRINHRALYTWAPDELLDECSSLVSTKAWRDHVREPSTYDHRAFAKRHDDDIVVLPCTLGEPVCGDERANNGVPFFYFYQVVFKRIGVRLPFFWRQRDWGRSGPSEIIFQKSILHELIQLIAQR